jgi:hypothetical protein
MAWLACQNQTKPAHDAASGCHHGQKAMLPNPSSLISAQMSGCSPQAFMAAAKPPKLVLAIEPSNYVFAILKIVTAKLDRVRCRKLALSHESGEVQLKTPVKKSGSLRVGLSHIGDGDEMTALCRDCSGQTS